MSYFLWIEDFDNSPKITTTEIFNNIVADELLSDDKKELRSNLNQHGIYIELNFQNGLDFIQKNLNKVDYIILDIDLIACKNPSEIKPKIISLLNQWHNDSEPKEDIESDEDKLSTALEELKAIAGYYLYTELVLKQGFPQQNILFCSNHGDNTKLIQKSFKDAKIELPKIYTKSDNYVQKWVKDNYNNEYSRLRRGIIEACQQIKTLIEQNTNNIQFDEFQSNVKAENIKDDMLDYLEILQTILPLREPDNKQHLYKLFTRTLAHEWDEKINKEKFKGKDLLKYTFGSIMKNIRNWSTHTAMFDELKANQVGFFFMIAMRSMFKLENETQSYENVLLKLYSEEKISEINEIELQQKLLDSHQSILDCYSKIFSNINLARLDFIAILQDMQSKDKNKINQDSFYLNALFYLFWHGLSPIEPNESSHQFLLETGDDKNKISYKFNYQIKPYDYGESGIFLFDLATAIYNSSFNPKTNPDEED